MSSVSQIYSLEQQLLIACLPESPDHDQLSHLIKQNPDWDLLFKLGEDHGVLPLIYHTFNKKPESLVPPEALKPFRNWFAANALRSMQLQKELARLLDLLNGAGVTVLPYKGPVLAEAAYGDVSMRSFVDLDLLVAPKQAWEVVQLLLAHGYEPGFDIPPERWPGLQRVDNHLPVYHREHDWIVEVHWDLFHPMYGLSFDLNHHFENAVEGQMTLSAEECLVMLCAHGTKHQWDKLKWVVDVDRLVRCGTIDWVCVLALAKRTGSIRCVFLALSLSERLLDTPVDQEIAARIAKEPTVKSLVDVVVRRLGRGSAPMQRQSLFAEYIFYLKSRDNWADQFKQVIRWLFYPRQADWKLFPLGDHCHALYYLERPVRMVYKWVIKPICRGTRKNTGRVTSDK